MTIVRKVIREATEERKPFWRCEECAHTDHEKAMPPDREAFYRKIHRTLTSPKCPRCKSEAFMPVGF